MSKTGCSAIGLLAVLFAAACGGSADESGILGATDMGDVSNPADRTSSVAKLDAACGTGAVTPAGSAIIRRSPYLQKVTTSSASVGWVSSAAGAQRVLVSLPDGTPIATGNAAPEAGALVRNAGENQMWAQLSSLAPNTVYCYSVEGDVGQLVARSGFKTAPAADSGVPVRFLAFGDSGPTDDQLALSDQMNTVPADLILHTGDIADGGPGTVARFEDSVFAVYAGLFRSLPFFPAAGNHEYETTADAAPFLSMFNLPNNERWYSYDWGNVHFVALNTEASLAEQAAWLEADLAASKQPWKIVYCHRPPYSSGMHGSDMNVRSMLSPIFEKYDVQLVISGHDHNYERITAQNGVTYVVSGGGGTGTRSVSSSSFTAFAQRVINFTYGEIRGDTLTLHAIDGNGTEFDSLVLRR